MKRAVARAGHELMGIARGMEGPHRDLRDRILLVALATLIADLIGSALVYAFEHGATGSEIATVGDSIFWTSCQLLTVSSQMRCHRPRGAGSWTSSSSSMRSRS